MLCDRPLPKRDRSGFSKVQSTSLFDSMWPNSWDDTILSKISKIKERLKTGRYFFNVFVERGLTIAFFIEQRTVPVSNKVFIIDGW